MKKLLVFSFAILFSVLIANGQKEICKVLLKEISGTYTGDCKNGLAHGKGVAQGKDRYEGKFKNGLPNGKGVYTWKSGEVYEGNWKDGKRHGLGIYYLVPGNKKTALEGKWANGEFVKKVSVTKPYKITYKNNLGRLSVVRVGDGNIVRLKFSRNGSFQTPADITLLGSSGTELVTTTTRGFKGIEFPFEATVKFTAPNDFNAATIRSEFRFTILEPGSWDFVVSY